MERNIETKGLGAGSYPEPAENGKEAKVTLNVEFTINMFVPKNWSNNDIKEEIRHNIKDYINMGEVEDWEVEIN